MLIIGGIGGQGYHYGVFIGLILLCNIRWLELVKMGYMNRVGLF
jgi:hypothetical protein